MTAAQGISKYGFRSWYERELILCHSYLVTSLLCMVLVLVLFENVGFRSINAWTLGALLVIVLATVFGGVSLNRYAEILTGVMKLADECVCAQCRTYGRVQVTASGRTEHEAHPHWMRLQCGQCGHQWRVESRLV